MKKIKRNFANSTKAPTNLREFDYSYEGFAIDHKAKTIYVLAETDIAIRNRNAELLYRYFDIQAKYPNYSSAVLHFVFWR